MSIFDPFAPNTNALLGAVLSGGDPYKLARWMVGEKEPVMIRYLKNDDGAELDDKEVRDVWPGALEALQELGQAGTLYEEDDEVDELRFEPDDPALPLVRWGNNAHGRWEPV